MNTITNEKENTPYTFPDETDTTLVAFRKSIARYAEKELAPHAAEWEEAAGFPRSVYAALGATGLLGIRIPEEYGGAGRNILYSAAFVEELCNCRTTGLVISVLMHAEIATPLLAGLGTAEQKERFLPAAVRGESVAGLAITEPGAGSDVAALRTSARRTTAGWILNGAKTFVTNGATADFLIVVAATHPEARHRGLSLFVVPTNTPGFRVGAKLKKLGNRASDTALIHLEDLELPNDALLGEEGRGFYYIMNNFQAERVMGGVLATALSRLMWQDGLNYAKSRSIFGKQVAQFQIWRHELAQLAAEIDSCAALTYRALYRMCSGQDALRETTMCKLLACELVEKVATRMLQVHGGYGYMEEYDIARFYRDVRLLSIGGGSTEVMREILARQCGIDDR